MNLKIANKSAIYYQKIAGFQLTAGSPLNTGAGVYFDK